MYYIIVYHYLRTFVLHQMYTAFTFYYLSLILVTSLGTKTTKRLQRPRCHLQRLEY